MAAVAAATFHEADPVGLAYGEPLGLTLPVPYETDDHGCDRRRGSTVAALHSPQTSRVYRGGRISSEPPQSRLRRSRVAADSTSCFFFAVFQGHWLRMYRNSFHPRPVRAFPNVYTRLCVSPGIPDGRLVRTITDVPS
ncbi:hypothetical protein CDD83_1632 [Cordyceps sp. RAO-2017]|nr:hypothetical protein CDD83_1632 [Cordyceps sp. RAO-2017]